LRSQLDDLEEPSEALVVDIAATPEQIADAIVSDLPARGARLVN
jgi:gluconate kinase